MKNTEKSIDLASMSREELEQFAEKMSTEMEALKTKLNWYEEQFRLSRQKRFGASSEKTDSNFEQLSFFNEAESESDETVAEPEMVDVRPRRGANKKKKGHKDQITKPLPKKVIEYKLSGDELVCPECGGELHSLKKEVRKELTVIPATVTVTEHVVYSYACRNCDMNSTEGTVVRADAPKPVFRNSLASPSFLADIIVKKYDAALPLYRQERILNQAGIMLSRQTMANWVIKAASEYLTPLYDIMHRELIKRDIIHADETTLEVLKEPGRNAETNSYMWLYRTSGCDSKQPIVLYDYQQGRSGDYPKAFLKGFKGYLQTDGYAGYNKVTAENAEIIPVGCMAHARRKYDEVLKAMPKDADKTQSVSAKGLEYCNKLFSIEREATKKKLSFEERKKLRDEEAVPVFEAFLAWAKSTLENSNQSEMLRKALTYTINQAQSLGNYLLDGRIEISNNRAERSIKPFVIGRKNWLFSNTPKGAKASAIIYSLMETAKECNLNVFEYFQYIFETLPKVDLRDSAKLTEYLPYSDSIPEKCRIKAENS